MWKRGKNIYHEKIESLEKLRIWFGNYRMMEVKIFRTQMMFFFGPREMEVCAGKFPLKFQFLLTWSWRSNVLTPPAIRETTGRGRSRNPKKNGEINAKTAFYPSGSRSLWLSLRSSSKKTVPDPKAIPSNWKQHKNYQRKIIFFDNNRKNYYI